MADNQFRKRDPDFKNAQRYKNKPVDRKGTLKGKKYFQPSDFKYNPEKNKLICPVGNELYVKNRNFKSSNGLKGIVYSGKKTDYRGCSIRKKCLRSDMSEQRQVVIFTTSLKDSENYTSRMIKQFDTEKGRHIYSRRMGAVEPVFANIRSTLGLNRFTLHGKIKVDIQWKLYCMVHNIGKIAKFGMSQA